ncbi:MAG: response regulator [Methylobacter sp.]|nr:response regulator [Methylobacter sp.]MDP2097469.1 response regulator [Methylobacter sp.]MDP2427243.1 response regulator [Methylobacter sp.]MDP3053985.1 response regulator [Methylobacter sp.]MDP3361573.1 response regulator [Methylobacter sp.]
MNKQVNNPNFVEILLLEDEPSDAYLVKMALKEAKVLANLHHVVDGREGLDFLNRTEKYADAPRPDLIFLDLNMPRMNGCEFLAVIKADERFKGIPTVVLTTSSVESDVVRSYQLGATSYITKPVDMPQFVNAIQQIGDYWFSLVRLPQGFKP